MNPFVPLKTRPEIDRLRHAAEAIERVLADLATVIRPGIRTRDLEQVARLALSRHGLHGILEGYNGYPHPICTSVNNIAAHGRPSHYLLQPGDLISVDVSGERNGWKADCAWTYCVGPIGPEQRRLLRAAWRSTLAGASAARPGNRLGDIGAAILAEAHKAGCSVVKTFTGHGIGTALHEPPVIAHVAEPGTGEPIVPGMVLNVEPVLTLGTGEVHRLDDGWSYVTSDGSLAAQFELTVAVRSDRTDLLTLGRHAATLRPSGPPYGCSG